MIAVYAIIHFFIILIILKIITNCKNIKVVKFLIYWLLLTHPILFKKYKK